VPNENNISRRGLLMKLGILFNGLVAIALAITYRTISSFVGYERTCHQLTCPGCLSGAVSEFPEGETRLANNFEIPM